MKRKDIIKLLEKNGYSLKREGAEHTIYEKDGKSVPIPRHREINEILAKSIIKKLELK